MMSGVIQGEDKKPREQGMHINLKVKGQDGNEVFFKIKRNTQLKKLMNAYCDRQSIDFNSIAFLFDGRRLHGEQTPDVLEMEDGDEIDAMLHQTGGCSDKRRGESEEKASRPKNTMKEHKKQLQRLEEKDPEFYQFLKEHDKELLEFDDEDIDEDTEGVSEIETLDEDIDIDKDIGFDDVEPELSKAKGNTTPRKVITSEMVDIWCTKIKMNKQLKAVRSLLRAFRTACHHGDNENESLESFSIVSSGVFNKIMLFALNEMDEVLRGLLQFPRSGGKKETIMDLTNTGAWKKFGILMKIYLSNALHVLNQMTDEQMIAFTLKRIKDSAVFLGAFPTLLRKYLKVLLHFWSIGGGALRVVSFLFLRDLCVRLGQDCLETCLRGIYKAYVSVCKVKGKYASVPKLCHLRFLENCVTELYGVDLSSAYQHAFICIRQLATILRNALSEKPKGKKEDGGGKKEKKIIKGRKKSEVENTMNKKGACLRVYDWQFINCLELWTTVICAHSSDADFQHLAYPLTQIIFGVARLVPTARYLPIRLQCTRMLNRLGACTKTFIPVSLLLLDVLEMKELTNPPTGGVGKAVDLITRKLVGKPTLKTRAFQEACIFSVVEQLAEHLTQWSYSVAFFELSFLTVVRLRSFCKICRVDMFRKEIKELIHQVEANSEFTNARRESVRFSSSDVTVSSFLKAEKESGSSPLSQFATELKKKARQRSNSMVKTSVIVGAKSSKFGDNLPECKEEGDDYDDAGKNENEDPEEGTAIFSTSWLPDPKAGLAKSKLQKEQQKQTEGKDMANVGADEDVVEDLVLSSDDDEPAFSGSFSGDEEDTHQLSSSTGESKKRQPSFAAEKQGPSPGENKKRKLSSTTPSKKKRRPLENKKSKKNILKRINS